MRHVYPSALFQGLISAKQVSQRHIVFAGRSISPVSDIRRFIVTETITIEAYSPGWASDFRRLEAVYRKSLAGLFDDIQHVGSTSVPGLAAKPIIDIDIIISDGRPLPEIVRKLETLGYEHRGNLGISDREAFRRSSGMVPVDGAGATWPKHNLYVCPAGSISLRNHLALRDFLRGNPDRAAAYGALKKQLALQYPGDIDSYIEGKTAFITAILEEVGFDAHSIGLITAENRGTRPGKS